MYVCMCTTAYVCVCVCINVFLCAHRHVTGTYIDIPTERHLMHTYTPQLHSFVQIWDPWWLHASLVVPVHKDGANARQHWRERTADETPAIAPDIQPLTKLTNKVCMNAYSYFMRMKCIFAL